MMRNSENPLATRIRVGWWLAGIGLLLFAGGLALSFVQPDMERASRFASGIGIALAIVGAVQIVQYRMFSKDSATARRIALAETDERAVQIRLRAGMRGFYVAMVLIFGALMWVSAESGSGATLNVDALWYYLSACVVLPLLVFALSQVYDARNF